MKKKTFSGQFTFIKVIPVLLLVLSVSFASYSGKNNEGNRKSQFYLCSQSKAQPKTEADKMPEFPGGQESLVKFIIDNVKYPEAAKSKGIEGKVMVSFIVTKTGKLDKIRVQKSVNELLDKEAIRVISSMPKWVPGSNKGVPVDVEMTLPISFKLS